MGSLKVKMENKEIVVEGGMLIQQEIIMIAILLLSPSVSFFINNYLSQGEEGTGTGTGYIIWKYMLTDGSGRG